MKEHRKLASRIAHEFVTDARLKHANDCQETSLCQQDYPQSKRADNPAVIMFVEFKNLLLMP